MPPSVSEKRALLKKYWFVAFNVVEDLEQTVVDGLTDAQVNSLFNVVKDPVKAVLDAKKAKLEAEVSDENTEISELGTDAGDFT